MVRGRTWWVPSHPQLYLSRGTSAWLTTTLTGNMGQTPHLALPEPRLKDKHHQASLDYTSTSASKHTDLQDTSYRGQVDGSQEEGDSSINSYPQQHRDRAGVGHPPQVRLGAGHLHQQGLAALYGGCVSTKSVGAATHTSCNIAPYAGGRSQCKQSQHPRTHQSFSNSKAFSTYTITCSASSSGTALIFSRASQLRKNDFKKHFLHNQKLSQPSLKTCTSTFHSAS